MQGLEGLSREDREEGILSVIEQRKQARFTEGKVCNTSQGSVLRSRYVFLQMPRG